MSDERPQTSPPVVWWILWVANLSGLFILHSVLGGERLPQSLEHIFGYICIAPLVVSCFLRWWVMPKQQKAGPALVLFIVGVALAEGCGLMGVLLGGEQREELFVLGVLGIVQWAPFFARRFPRVATDQIR